MLRVEYTTDANDRALVVYTPNSTSPPARNLKPLKQSPASFSSARSARSRAFNRCQRLVWFNPDLTLFVTLTYADQHTNYQMILDDLKNLFSRKNTKYIAVVETHVSGFYHIHALINDTQDLVSLRKGKTSLANWYKGFSDVKFLDNTDDNFNVSLYLLKYINKSEKIGGRYFLSSRNLIVPDKHSMPIGSRSMRPADNVSLTNRMILNDLQFSQFHDVYPIPNFDRSVIIKIYK